MTLSLKPIHMVVLVLAVPFTLAGCDDHDHDHDAAHASTQMASDPTAHGHAHADPRPLPAMTVGAYQVQGIVYGVATPGGYLPVDVMVAPQNLQAVRLWIGDQQATGVMRVRATAMHDRYHADIPVAKPLPADARLWIELDTAGTRIQQAFDLP